MTKAVSAWAMRFFGKGLGYDSFDISSKPEDYIENMYMGLFFSPLQSMCGTLDASTINMAVTHMSNCLPGEWPYLLKHLVDSGLFVNTGNFTKDFTNAVQALNKRYKRCGATADPKLCKDIIVYYNTEEGIVGDYPSCVYAYPLSINTHRNGRYAADLLKKELLYLSSADREVLTDLFDLGLLNESDVTISCSIPVADGKFEDITVPLNDTRIPPAEVLRLIRNLPSALIAENDCDAYKALRSYSLTTDVPTEVLTYLNDTISNHFGNDLVPVEESQQYTSTEEYLMNHPDFVSGTLDTIILDYCKQENIDTKCTIEQLIEYINYDVTIKPATTQELVKKDMNARSLSKYMTLEEYTTNSPHIPIDDVEIALGCIVGYEMFPVDVQEAIKASILNDEPYVRPVGDYAKILTDAGLSSNLVDVISKALSTGSKVDMASLNEEIINNQLTQDSDFTKQLESRYSKSEDYVKVLTDAGLSPNMAGSIAQAVKTGSKVDLGKFDTELAKRQIQNSKVIDEHLLAMISAAQNSGGKVTLKDAFLNYLPNLGLDNDTLSRLTIAARTDSAYEPPAPKVIEQPLKRTVYDEDAYNAGEILLRKTREAISQDASFDVREKFTPILYTFLRLLMCDLKTEKEDVREFLLNKMKGVDSATAEIIQEALNEIK